MDRYVDCGLWTWRSLFPCAVMMLNVAKGKFSSWSKKLKCKKSVTVGQKGLNWISFPRVNNYVMRGSQRWSQPRATILSLTQRSSLLPCLSFCSCYPFWKNSTHRCARLVLLAIVVLLLSLVLFASLELLTSLALNAWLVGITCITYITCITCITCIREATKKSCFF